MSSQSAQIRCDERMREEMRTGLIEEARSGKDGIPQYDENRVCTKGATS